MRKLSEIPVLFCIVVMCSAASGALTLQGPKCGQKICKLTEYCSQYHSSCESCALICDDATHNYDPKSCEDKCQDYIHDARYVLKDEVGSGSNNLKATVQKLSHMVTALLILVCLLIVALVSMISINIYKWKQRKNITFASLKKGIFSKKSQSPPKTAAVSISNEKPDLRLEIPEPSTESNHSPMTMTTSISRRPAEDSTLDYAYDNPALNSSPTPKSNGASY